MSHPNLTSGAQRVLTEIAQRLEASESPGNAFRLLLQILATTECRAAEILENHGIPRRQFEDATEQQEVPAGVDFLNWQRNLLRQADRIAIEAAPGAPLTGTEHLLLAIVDLDEASAVQLTNAGLTRQRLTELIIPPEPDLDAAHLEIQIGSAETGTPSQAALFRILDASANRCREGLRVVEDAVRFHLDDAQLMRELKEIRHLLTRCLNQLGQHGWVWQRDTVNDVGPRATLASERERGTITDVLRANLKRVEESLRSLEEYGKLIDEELSGRISECRYRFYTVEKALEAMYNSRQRLADCRLYVLVTGAECRYGAETLIRNVTEVGVDVVQIREKSLSDRALLNYAKTVREWTSASGTLLILNDRVDIAAACGADGVHLGQDDLDVESARRILGGNKLIGVSTHNAEQARNAVFAGADYLGVGPVFPSRTKVFSEFAGLEFVSQMAAQTAVPWFAIGGITRQNLHQVQRAGASRIAVSRELCAAADPRGVARALASQLAPRDPAAIPDKV